MKKEKDLTEKENKKQELSPEEIEKKKKERKSKIFRLSLTAIIFALVLGGGYLALKLTGTLDMIDSAEELKELILAGGAFSYVIFFIFQFLQATFLPIPAAITTIAGSLVFGPLVAALISFAAILCASILMFWLGRKVGKKLINWMVGEEDGQKWADKLGKGKFVFFLMMLFPLFPDDILCLVAGTTSITFRFFITTMLIARPIGIFTTCYFGSGTIIPFSGWGIPVWIGLVILALIAFYISIKYQKQIENTITRVGQKLSKKK